MLRKNGVFMPTDKNDTENSGAGEKNKQERMAALIRAIKAEMDAMTPAELERLYAVVALMEKNE
jgi:hypothetical protein